VRSSHAERLRMNGVSRRRADLLPAGALILSALAEALELEGYTVSDWGLREGVILEWLGLAHAHPPV
jgi:exopolyphosphatase/guanosine-5'-triphosphate,3'-diphosphate pyrophosphatase